VPALKEETQRLSLRERLEHHRNQRGCAQCHAKIDPWGVPFEEFDAGGRLKREPVDARSTLPDKTEVGGVRDLKRYLAEDRIDQVAFSVLKHLATYATGRNLSHNEVESLAAAAAPDGYTVFLGNVGTLAINPSIFGARQKVTVADMEPISLVANAPDMLVSTAALPVNSVAEFVEYARKNSDKMSFASPGSGSLNRLEMELFRNVSQLEMVHVPYKGGAGPALVDVVGGQVPIMFAPIPAVMQLVKAGRLKALAVASQERLPFMPEVPTMVESGYPQVVGGSWQALLFPAKTPQKIVMQFHAAATKVLAEDDVRQRLLQGGVEVAVSATPDHLRDFINEEAKRWGAVAKVANATAD
jgi:tripartite-type tricarboxylate transporter receptor subunit TctC